jgi:hypothetical protein
VPLAAGEPVRESPSSGISPIAAATALSWRPRAPWQRPRQYLCVDAQNEPPLPPWFADWQVAMDWARKAVGELHKCHLLLSTSGKKQIGQKAYILQFLRVVKI